MCDGTFLDAHGIRLNWLEASLPSASHPLPSTLTDVKVEGLEPSTVGHNLVVQVVSFALLAEKVRFDGDDGRMAEITLADETGAVTMRARGDQIDKLPVGSVVVLRNAGISMYKGYMRLVVNKWGKISAHPDDIASTPPAPPSINTDNDLSKVEYELVQVLEDDQEEAEADGTNQAAAAED